MSTIADNIGLVSQRIRAAADAVQRDASSIHLLAVSKTKPAQAVREAYAAGLRDFGENYLQEALGKQADLTDLPLSWHFIGPIQSNKTRAIAENFAWVHSVDRLKIAQRLSEQRPADLPPLNICIQVNVSGEASKSGVSVYEASALAHLVADLPHIRLRGLMAIPEPVDDFARQRDAFRRVREVFEQLNREGLSLDTLSMGMSHDYPFAVECGSNMVRVGSLIFGERDYAK